MDVYNLFNNLNLDPNQLSKNLATATSARLRALLPRVSSHWVPV